MAGRDDTVTDYKPTPLDLGWTLDLIDHLNDHGVWIWPTCGLIYTIDKANKTFCLFISQPNTEEAQEKFEKVLGEIGWKVEKGGEA